MSKSAKNLIVILGIITTVFAAYYFLTQETALVLRTDESNQQLQELLLKAETFTQHQKALSSITLDTSLFDSPEFNSLRGYAPEPVEFEVGRPDPFLPTALDTFRASQPQGS